MRAASGIPRDAAFGNLRMKIDQIGACIVGGGSGIVCEALAKPPRDMGVPPMKHGQDARATPARKGFCRIF